MNQFVFPLILAFASGCGQVEQGQEPPPKAAAPSKTTAQADARRQPELKNLLALSPSAAERILELLAADEERGKSLRLYVDKNYQYQMGFDDKKNPDEDYRGESRNVPILIDRKSAKFVPLGTVLNFVTVNGEAGFTFAAPEPDKNSIDASKTLSEARRGFKTVLTRQIVGDIPAADPPKETYRKVQFEAPPGKLTAYLSLDLNEGKRRPAIVWISGGDCASIGMGCIRDGEPFLKAGMAVMFPSLRGGNDSPGANEGLYGEVDDVLAAADYLSKQPFVDPQRVYLGGHSTGGTLVLLTAACSDRFRAVFAFGATNDVVSYGPAHNPFALYDPKELELRSPARWLHSMRNPVFVFEGESGDMTALKTMARVSTNPKVKFFGVENANHFSVVVPVNELIAEKIARDTGPKSNLTFTEKELNKRFGN